MKNTGEEGGFKIHPAASRGRGIKGRSEWRLFGRLQARPRETGGCQAWPVSWTVWLVSIRVHGPSLPDHRAGPAAVATDAGFFLAPYIPGNDMSEAQA